MDVARGEMVEKQLDAMIQRRARKGDLDPDEREELWKASVRAYNIRRREEMRAGGAEHPTQPFGWMVEAWLLTRLAEWVSENPRHQGFAAKTLPELDALAEPTGADA